MKTPSEKERLPSIGPSDKNNSKAIWFDKDTGKYYKIDESRGEK